MIWKGMHSGVDGADKIVGRRGMESPENEGRRRIENG